MENVQSTEKTLQKTTNSWCRIPVFPARLQNAAASLVAKLEVHKSAAADNSVSTRICLKQNCTAVEFIRTHYGYPNASAAGIDRVLEDHNYTVTGSGTQRNFRPEGVATNNNNCRIRYVRAAAANIPPEVTIFTSGC